ncbi:MAG: hypothetical protein WAM14_25110, partial [Candidatus Nitrosopolaris sp.]
MRIKVINIILEVVITNPYTKMNDALTHIRKYIVNGSYGITISANLTLKTVAFMLSCGYIGLFYTIALIFSSTSDCRL